MSDYNPLQAAINAMSDAWKRERAESQMTLGKMIDALSALAPDAEVDALEKPDSYRGYYEDLAFVRASGKMKASELLALCQSAMGRSFQGYKGGEFMMGEDTPVWIAPWGDTGDKIMALNERGVWEVAPDKW